MGSLRYVFVSFSRGLFSHRAASRWALVSVSCMTAMLAGCGSGTKSATAPSTPSPSTSASGPVITTPASNIGALQSPILFTGSVASTPDVDHSRVLLDGTSILYGGILPMKNFQLFIPDGQHTLVLAAYDKNDNELASTSTPVDISGQVSPAHLSQLQNIPAWQFCTQDLAGTACASGLGQSVSTQTQSVATPSLSGSSAEFTLSGTQGYSNALWWVQLGGGTLLSKFTYDLDFYVNNPDVVEALEFDVNQSYGGVRYTYGTECSYKNTHMWDVWDPQHLVWVPSSVPCPPVAANTWHHLTWQFERVNKQVHYISVTLDNVTRPVNLYLNPEPNWNKEDIDVAFQMDGDSNQDPYNVWLDNVTLTASY